MDLTKSVNADRRRDPARLTMGHQGTEVARTETLWPTRSSRMGRHYFVSNNFFCGHCRNYRPIRRVGKAKVFWGLRSFSFKAPSICPSWAIGITVSFRIRFKILKLWRHLPIYSVKSIGGDSALAVTLATPQHC